MQNKDDEAQALDPQLKTAILSCFERIPFNKLLGMKMSHIGHDRVEVTIPMKPELVGNFIHGILHGGVVSSVLDVAGGCMALLGAMERSKDKPEDERLRILSRIGTIDIRVDYLRPGKGEVFTASARLLRTGNKVAVTRMEMHNESGEILALGTGTYLCG